MKHTRQWFKELDRACPVYSFCGFGGYGYRFMGESMNLSDCIYKTRRAAKLARAKDPRILSYFH